jgi:hypothetical protein
VKTNTPVRTALRSLKKVEARSIMRANQEQEASGERTGDDAGTRTGAYREDAVRRYGRTGSIACVRCHERMARRVARAVSQA